MQRKQYLMGLYTDATGTESVLVWLAAINMYILTREEIALSRRLLASSANPSATRAWATASPCPATRPRLSPSSTPSWAPPPPLACTWGAWYGFPLRSARVGSREPIGASLGGSAAGPRSSGPRLSRRRAASLRHRPSRCTSVPLRRRLPGLRAAPLRRRRLRPPARLQLPSSARRCGQCTRAASFHDWFCPCCWRSSFSRTATSTAPTAAYASRYTG